MTKQEETVAHSELVSGSQTTLHSHAGSGGITYEYSESEGESNTSSTSWQDKLTHTVQTSGDYLVQWNFELGGATTTYHCRSQVLHNSTELANIQFEPEDVSPSYWLGGSGFRKLSLSEGDTIKIQFCCESTSGTTYIRYARIFLLGL